MADINGSWFLSFIPLIVGSTVGGAISPHLPIKNAVVLIMTAFLMWAVGIGMSSVLLPIYFWRLMTAQLPARAAIVTTFVPVGPYGMGAYSIQQLSSDLARCISEGFTLDATIGSNEMSTRLIGEGIQWIGVIVALMCLGIASFWLVEACLSVGTKPPRSFSIGENHFQAQRSHADPIQRLLELCVSLWRLLKRMELAQYKSAKRGHERLGCDLHRSHTSAMAYVRHSDYVFWSVCPSAAQWLADRDRSLERRAPICTRSSWHPAEGRSRKVRPSRRASIDIPAVTKATIASSTIHMTFTRLSSTAFGSAGRLRVLPSASSSSKKQQAEPAQERYS